MPAVLQVIQQGELRGAEVFALDLSRTLARRHAWRVSLLSLFGTDEAYAEAVRAGDVPLAIAQPDGRARGFDPRLAWRLRGMIEAGGYDVVQANGAATLKYLAAARRLSARPWRLVYRAIGLGSHWRRRLDRRLLYRWLFAQTDRVVAVAAAVADDLVAASAVDRRRIVVIPNGVEPSRIAATEADRRATRGALGVADGEVVLVHVGTLAPEKNLTALVAVTAACRRRGLPVRAVLVGDGPCRDAVARAAREQAVEAAVTRLPAQPRVGAYLAAADLYVSTSLSEGMPAALIEAGLAGLPAVAYAVGGVPEVVADGETGVLVPAGNERALTDAVAALVTDQGRRARMARAARAACRRFEIAPVAAAYHGLYASLLAARATGEAALARTG
jgi:glycosyltransferase involved in cell wall biosynthesis